MLGAQVQVFFVALCWSLVLVEVTGAPRRDELMETIRSDLLNEQNVTHWLLLRFMSNLMAAPSDEVIRERENDEEADGRGRDELMRRHLSLAQRERKAGCRNFFWKTFTSC